MELQCLAMSSQMVYQQIYRTTIIPSIKTALLRQFYLKVIMVEPCIDKMVTTAPGETTFAVLIFTIIIIFIIL